MENERNVAEVIRDLKDVQLAPNTFGLIHVTGLANQRISFSDLAAKSLKEIVSPSTTSLDNLINAIDKSNIDLLLTFTPESCIWGSPEDVGSGVIDALYTDRVEQLTRLGKT
ncbi:KR domain-containing protein, partial [Salmonella sp. s55004]|uniref:KR domain-containing protein n=1 Tax=Salmonella sp. s55004 TaxID=3159675 RepID=UPI00397EA92D